MVHVRVSNVAWRRTNVATTLNTLAMGVRVISEAQSKQVPTLSKEDVARFWGNVERDTNERGCWLFTGSVNSNGYGRFFVGGKHIYAHRIAWQLVGREPPPDLLICHTCDNSLCVNPDHLIAADIATNNRNAKAKRNLVGRRKMVKKPSKDFPLFPHATGRWAKKIRGKLVYFGHVENDVKGEAALAKWLDEKDDLLAGRIPCVAGDGLTVADLCSKFLDSKYAKLQTGELSPRSFADCKMTTDRIARVFGKKRLVDDLAADDFAELRRDIAKTRNPESVGNEINRIRGVFKFGTDNHLMEKAIRYGSDFNRPSRRVLRKVRNERERKFLEAGEIRQMIGAANVQLRAMILLGVNAGLGNSDVANLPTTAINLQAGWLDFPRPKTGIDRRCPLWPETIEAITAWLAVRPQPKDPEAHGHLLFLTAKTRSTWATDQRVNVGNPDLDALAAKCLKASDNPVSKEVRKLLTKLGIKRKGVSFYSLRHVFETIGGECRDQVAVDAIMGHADESMSARYREHISDDRLQAVVTVVRGWLFGVAAVGSGEAPVAVQEQADDRHQLAIAAARAAIETATGPTRRTLETAWLREIENATAGDGEATRQLIETWGTSGAGDDRGLESGKQGA